MSSKTGHAKLYVVACLAGAAVIGLYLIALVWAADNPRRDYLGYDLSKPWFDGKPWALGLDMYNGASIKPQEVGTFQRFPDNSVPRSGVEPDVPDVWVEDKLLRDLIPENPTRATAASIANGRKIFNIYCAACHGRDGKAQVPVVRRGIPMVPIDLLRNVFSEAHIYNRIRYGGGIMPTYGFQTTRGERWDIVNYLKSQNFGK